jgi:methionyl-tRNA formyltransferase
MRSRLNPKIVYITCCDNGYFGLRYLYKAGHHIEQVITISQETAKKYQVSGYVDVVGWCNSLKIPVTILSDYCVDLGDISNSCKELLIVNGWNRLIPINVINKFSLGALGVHAGHPPIGLGRAPLVWNLIKGHRDLEVYVFNLTERADDGDILAIDTVEIVIQDTVKTLYEKVMYKAACLFNQAIHAVQNRYPKISQNSKYQVIYPKRNHIDGLIDFRESVDFLVNFIRAQSDPYPGAYAYLRGQKCIIWDAIPFDSFSFRAQARTPGKIMIALPSGLIVQTGTSPLWIKSASISGSIFIPRVLQEMEKYVDEIFDIN